MIRRNCGWLPVVLAVCLLALFSGAAHASVSCSNPSSNTVTCTGGASASVNATNGNFGNETGCGSASGGACPATAATPSIINVTGGGGTVSTVSVTLHGYSAVFDATQSPDVSGSHDIGLLLVSPNGTEMELMRCIGHGNAAGETNLTLTIEDSSSNTFPSCNPADTTLVGSWMPGNGATVNYKPASYFDPLGFSDAAHPNYASVVSGFNSATFNVPATQGGATMNGAFLGNNVNGGWTLDLVVDASRTSEISFSSWDITITYTAASTPSTTTLSVATPNDSSHVQANAAYSSGNDSSITLTATVTSGATGSVTFQDVSNGSTTNLSCNGGGDSVALSGDTATCVTTISTEGYRSLLATYSGNSTFVGSSGNAAVFIQRHATNTGTTYCNTGGISGNGEGAHSSWSPSASTENTNPYPSVIFVGDGVNTDITNSVNTVSVQLNNFVFSGQTSEGMHLLLVAPSGQALDFLDAVGGTNAFNGNYTIQDGASQLPNFATSTISSGTYEPTAWSKTDDIFTPAPPSPAPQLPASFNLAEPDGSSTFLNTFAGATSHGPWTLFIVDDGGSLQSFSVGNWCIDISPASGAGTSISIQATVSGNITQKAALGTNVTFTATVSSTSAVNQGTVTFTDTYIPTGSTTSLGSPGVSNGTASVMTNALIEGDHKITATYQDSTTFNDSSTFENFRVDSATSTPTLSNGVWSYCNPAGITIPANQTGENDTGQAAPNPSNIFVTNLPGTIAGVTLTLNSFHLEHGPIDVDSLLVGPNGSSNPTTAQTLDFFSAGSNDSPYGPQTTTFGDSGAALSCTGSPSASTQPASCTSSTSYTASSFYTLPASFQHAQPAGGFTFNTGTYNAGVGGGVYLNTNANGTWSLYFNEVTADIGSGATGWCMNFTENAVSVGVSESHIGGNFVQGQQGAQLTTMISNSGPGPTGDPDNNHPLTVTDTLNGAFSYQSFTGTGWSCNASGQTVTCTNHNAIPQGSSYPTLTLSVNVSNTATPGTVNNTVNVSGGGITPNSGSDMITIISAPVLSVAKSHTGTFTQGQTAEWDITVNNTASGSITAGTTSVSDTLPIGYSLNNYSGSGWTCGSTGTSVSCTSTQAVSGVGSFPTLKLIVNVPSNSPTSVSNSASAWGGGDLNHTSSGTAAVSNTDSVSVVQVPAQISINGNQTQSATIQTAFGSLAVTLKDAGGVVIPSYSSVVFTATTGGNGQSGAFNSDNSNTISIQTNSGGVADPGTFTANSKVGSYSVGVSAGAATATFNLTNLVGQPANISVTSGSGQSTTINTAFTNPLVATVTDAGNNPVPNATVTFTAPAQTGPSATFAGGVTTATTNASGVATSVTVSANGNAGGPYNVAASVNGHSVNFMLTNLVGQPANISVTSGSGQSTTVNTAFANPLVVTVTDAGNNPVPNATVTFTAPAQTGPSATFAGGVTTAVTNASGVATSVTVSANANAGGPYSVTASVNGHSVNFMLTNVAQQFQLTTQVSPAGSGTISPASETVNAGTMVSVQATPNAGWMFTGFTGALSGNTNPQNLTVNGTDTVTANFAPLPTSLGGSIGAKSGPQNARLWPVSIGNNGPGVAVGAEITGITLVQLTGSACTPVVTTPLPALASSTIAPKGSAVVDVTLDFTGCAANASFRVTVNLSANSGAASGTITGLQLQ